MIRAARRHHRNHRLTHPQTQAASTEAYSLLRVQRRNKDLQRPGPLTHKSPETSAALEQPRMISAEETQELPHRTHT